ncbi:CRP/FNR family transcriptional regulator, anaerobic regulatory protein [Mariniphaga anaerophila]|uniref:CRP/FNR family transcriptional regulator, anaerobic regulatory protein n=1 Tax=Mariniphaga anaerophila TaxID=1484053 RepID=A0A1M4XRF8_9BACT|nr:Crp/Fnr family transcriptional regulator [Mariniphaga anaerophila]SHE96031.1 CRP/FNR family transcriptional regulator, anaerobic regulatory protein [Mariniphaga anaerophila]
MDDVIKLYNFLEKDLLDEIVSKGVRKKFAANKPLMREGQFISSFPLIIRGMIRITRTSNDGNELLLYYLQENEVCAMSLTCCMAHQKSNVMAVAEEETEALMLPVSLLDKWMCEYPSWRQFVMQTFQSRFRELIETIDSIAFLRLDERLVKFFTDRYQKLGNPTFFGTHQELAIQLNTSREVVSRLLKKLEKDGKIELSRNFIDFSGLV